MASEVVEKAVYELTIRGQEKLAGLVGALDRVVVSSGNVVSITEKVTRATRASADEVDRFIARRDKQVSAEQQLMRGLETVKRFEEEGVGTKEKLARATELVVQKYHEQTQALTKSASGIQDYNAAVTQTVDLTKKLEADLVKLNTTFRAGGQQGEYAAAFKALITTYNEASQAAVRYTEAQQKVIEQSKAEQVATSSQRAFNQQLGVNPESGKGSAAESAKVFTEAAAEQDRLTAATQKYKNALDPTLTVTKAYKAELAAITELYNKGKLTSGEATTSIERATAAYNTQIKEVTGVAAAERETAKEQEKLAASAQHYRDQLDPLLPLQRRFQEEQKKINDHVKAGTLTQSEGARSLVLLQNSYNVVEKGIIAAQKATGGLSEGVLGATQRSRAMQFALTNLGFQINDVVTSLASGISPMQTFSQQAGQFVQVFTQGGGVKAVLGELGATINGLITPTRLLAAGFVGVAAGAILLAVRAATAMSSVREFDIVLKGLGANSITNGTELESMAKRLRDVGLTAAEARTKILELSRAGLNPASAERVIRTSQNLIPVLGDQGAEQLVSALSGGLEPTIKFGLALHALNADQIIAWREMARGGEGIAALNQAFSVIEKSVNGFNREALSPMGEALRKLRIGWDEMLDAYSKTGPILAVVAALTDLVNLLERISKVATGEGASAVLGALTGAGVGARVGGLPGAVIGGAAGAVGGAYYAARSAPGTPAATAPIPGTTATGAAAAASEAASMVGLNERSNNNQIAAYLSSANIQLSPQDVAWCAAFANAALARQGIQGSGSNIATSFLNWGTGATAESVRPGDVLVQSRGFTAGQQGGHVGFATGATQRTDSGLSLEMVSGNLGGAVAKSWISANEVVVRRAVEAATSTVTNAATATNGPARSNAEDQKAQIDEIIKERERHVEVLQREGAASEVVAAKQEAAAIAARLSLAPLQKERVESALIADVYNRRAAEQAKVIAQTEREIGGISGIIKGYNDSVVSGLKAEAQAKAVEEAFKQFGELESPQAKAFIDERQKNLLESGAAAAIKAGTEQIALSQRQIDAAKQLADATEQGTGAAHAQQIENAALAQTHEAVSKAEAAQAGAGAIVEKSLLDIARASEKAKDAEANRIAIYNQINQRNNQIEQVQLATNLVGQAPEVIAAATAHLQEQQRLLAIGEPLTSKIAENDLRNVDALSAANAQWAEAVRQQQRLEESILNIIGIITNELNRSIENAFSGEKVESWGKRIKTMLGSISSQIASSLFLRPAIGTALGALGFGSVASQYGTFGGMFGGNTAQGSGQAANTGNVTTINVGGGGSLFNNVSGLFDKIGLGGTSNFFSNLGSNLGFATNVPGISAETLTSLGVPNVGTGLAGYTSSGGLFGSTTLGSFAGGVGAGFGAGTLLNSLLGGDQLRGTIGSGAGSLAGAAIGSVIFPGVGTLLGGLLGGAAGGGLGGMFGPKPSSFSSGAAVNLATGQQIAFSSSGNAQNDATVNQISSAIGQFSKEIQKLSGGVLDPNTTISPVASTKGIRLDYAGLAGFGTGSIDVASSEEAINLAKLATARALEGVTETMKKVIASVSDPADLAAAIQFAAVYDKIAETVSSLFSSIPGDLEQVGPFEQAKAKIAETFDSIIASATQFGLSLDPINKALDEANKRLTEDFNRNIQDQITAIEDPGKALAEAEGKIWKQRIKEAEAAGGDLTQVYRLNADEIEKIIKEAPVDQLSSLVAAFQELDPAVVGLAQHILDAAKTAQLADFHNRITAAANGVNDLGFINDVGAAADWRDKMNTEAIALGIPFDQSVGLPELNTITDSKVRGILQDKTITELQAVIDTFQTLHPELAAIAELMKPIVAGNFNRKTDDAILAVKDPVAALIKQERMLWGERLNAAIASGGDLAKVWELNQITLDKIWTDQTASLRETIKNMFSGLPGELTQIGPFQQASNTITSTFDELIKTANALEGWPISGIGDTLSVVLADLAAARARLAADFNRSIQDQLSSIDSPLAFMVEQEKRLWQTRLQEAVSSGGDLTKLWELNIREMNKIFEDQKAAVNSIFSGLPGELTQIGPFQQASDTVTNTFDELIKAANALAGSGIEGTLGVVLADLAAARARLATDFNRTIQDQLSAIDSPLAYMVEQERRLWQARLQEAVSSGGDLTKLWELNVREMNKIFEDQKIAVNNIFSGLPGELKQVGPFEQASDTITSTFDELIKAANALAGSGIEGTLNTVVADLAAARARLATDFNRSIQDQLSAIDDPVTFMIEQEKRLWQARLQEAVSSGGDLVKLWELNVREMDKIWEDQVSSIKGLREELKSGQYSGLAPIPSLKAANDNFFGAVADVRGGNLSRVGELEGLGRNAIEQSYKTFGNAPQTAGLRALIISAIDSVMALRSYASGTAATPEGWIKVGEQGPEWMYQSGGASILPHGINPPAEWDHGVAAPTSGTELLMEVQRLRTQISALISAGNQITQAAAAETIKVLGEQTSILREKPLVEPKPRKVA